ncbi:MAG: hypothetical protein Q4E46_02230 [Candidatus Saccharibacteria bacterium]|nr:hypothetical protein [Candidatus Saccharibacteria bacterium]
MKFQNPKLFAPHAKRIIFGLIIVCLLAVIGSAVATWYFSPDKVARREIERIARDYYENYFYNEFFANLAGDERTTEFEKYTSKGFSPTYLRQLLNYDDGKHQDSAKYFNSPDYTCDTNSTHVVFYPYPPFSEDNYTMKIEMRCGKP